ncbi:hypothetical protein THZG08_750001 [Vibrio owensii]|nr:hypothetical protein THZG08_750001 [Vibrio owensii]CAH1591479.1 hypothetical protein THOA03_740001 [Vibrio owensii]
MYLPLVFQHTPLDSYSEAFPDLEAQRPLGRRPFSIPLNKESAGLSTSALLFSLTVD